MQAGALVTSVERAFRTHARSDQAGAMEAYMKHQFPFLGLKRPERNALISDMLKHWKPEAEALMSAAEQLWGLEEREFKYVALDALIRYQKQLDASHVDRILALVLTESWWDTVDLLAGSVLSPMALRDRNIHDALFDLKDREELWLKRTSLLYMLKHGPKTDRERLEALVRAHAAESDFFLRKGIGWALRNFARVDPDWVRAVVARNALSPLSVREALKHL
ncbi:DNA alkylation repair protein [bacterium]|nr:DNA alkylation repair protein [bacterium]